MPVSIGAINGNSRASLAPALAPLGGGGLISLASRAPRRKVASTGVSIAVGETFCRQERFDAASISAFARSTGDLNPLHHDAEYAAQTRFGGVIASGSHVSALLTGMVAGHFADKGLNVGLDFSFRFQAPVRVDDTIMMRWTVTSTMPKLSLRGDILTLEGEAIRSDGIVAVSSVAHVLLFHA